MHPNSAFSWTRLCWVAIALWFAGGLVTPIAALSQSPPESKQTQPDLGFEFEGQRDLNSATITNIEYRGECPGRQAGTVAARFISTANPPVLGQRVIIQNVTRGMQDNPRPYTNRDYSQGRLAEATLMAYGTKHEMRTLSVLKGLNDFEYMIKQGDRTIQQGTFQATIQFEQEVERRWAQCQPEKYCLSGKAMDKCAEKDVSYRNKCTCPGGRSFYRY